MKNLFTVIIAVILTAGAFSQAPNLMSYQAVIRNSSNALVVSNPVGIQISILQGSPTGTAVYVETQTTSTNANGLISIEIGGGTVVSGNFATINWANGPFYIETQTDPTGGVDYTITGTSQLLSVPYSLYANTVNNHVSVTGDTLYIGNNHIIISGISIANHPPAIGTSYQGGIIAYILQPGDPGYSSSVQHGLIAAPSDQSTGIQWSNGSYITVGDTATAIGTGMANTKAIVAAQGVGAYAAYICDTLTLGGYHDWYLPSLNELNKLYINQIAVGGFSSNLYWSSTEYRNYDAWYQYFDGGTQGDNGKNATLYVRAVRAF